MEPSTKTVNGVLHGMVPLSQCSLGPCVIRGASPSLWFPVAVALGFQPTHAMFRSCNCFTPWLVCYTNMLPGAADACREGHWWFFWINGRCPTSARVTGGPCAALTCSTPLPRSLLTPSLLFLGGFSYALLCTFSPWGCYQWHILGGIVAARRTLVRQTSSSCPDAMTPNHYWVFHGPTSPCSISTHPSA